MAAEDIPRVQIPGHGRIHGPGRLAIRFHCCHLYVAIPVGPAELDLGSIQGKEVDSSYSNGLQ